MYEPSDIEYLKLKKLAEQGELPLGDELVPDNFHQYLQYMNIYQVATNIPDNLSINEFLGEPIFPTINELTDEVSFILAIDQVQNLLRAHHLMVEFPENMDIKEKYKFLTSDLLNLTVEDSFFDGMAYVFKYQEISNSFEK